MTVLPLPLALALSEGAGAQVINAALTFIVTAAGSFSSSLPVPRKG